jgi:DNA (cytosine-5)-methyltransferase 1
LDGITFSKWRAESIKGYGNAIVPQVAYQIFKAIVNCDDSCDDKNPVFIERVTM